MPGEIIGEVPVMVASCANMRPAVLRAGGIAMSPTRASILVLTALFPNAVALATGTVSFTLTSPSAGQTVTPGTSIAWSILVGVSTGDNLGLALFGTDMVQDPSNPVRFDLPYATGIPSAMTGFDRPGGITNPGEGGNPSGYVGVQRGIAGQKDLIQIGGAQNTFGQAGTSFGTDPEVDQGIGQSGPQEVVSGSFEAPATDGVYTYRLQNAFANVLLTVNAPPAFSQVAVAAVNLGAASFSFTVQSEPSVYHGDLNCDGSVDFGDINPFVMYLSSFAAWQATYADCPPENGDINGDGTYGQSSFGDINPFVALLTGGG
jgi:hypothetical protein